MIPREMFEYNQWCCSRSGDKRPLNPKTLEAAAVDDPKTWGTYEEAKNSGLPHVGFILTENDPFFIIDLDDPYSKLNKDGSRKYTDEQCSVIIERQQKVCEACKTYKERSQSGKGLHIIGTATTAGGKRRDEIEIYSSLRYMICTGDVFDASPVCNIQEIADILYAEMDTTLEIELEDVDDLVDDEAVVKMAMNASNADKFNSLCRGEQEEYPSQSEADFALLSIFAYYTRSNEQVRRLFRMSALGKRAKAIRDNVYLDRALRKIRAKQPPLVDLSALELNPAPKVNSPQPAADAPPAPTGKESIPEPSKVLVDEIVEAKNTLTFPDGLVGEIAQYVFESSIRPVPEVGIATALGVVAGVAGRCFNISGTGLNQYIMLIARTGSGKEGISGGINRLFNAVREKIPVIDQYIGPAVFASGQALLKTLDTKPCFISILGEIGLTLQQICDYKATSADKMLRRVLLDIYAKSGHGQMMQPMVYSDKEKNTLAVHAPNVTILGEATPGSFYDGLSQAQVAEGLIPRFSIIEYRGPRPPQNDHPFSPPSEQLIQRFGDLAVTALSAQQNNACLNVKIDPTAKKLLSDFNTFVDSKMNAMLDLDREEVLQLWNRAHLKTLKMAALLSVGKSLHAPTITQTETDWAIKFVCDDVYSILNKFKDGGIGTGDNRLAYEVDLMAKDYAGIAKSTKINTYKVPKTMLDHKVIPYCYFRRRAKRLAVFNKDRRGAVAALKATLDDMVLAEELILVPRDQAREEFKTRSPLYYTVY